jgi:hypothetical protein
MSHSRRILLAAFSFALLMGIAGCARDDKEKSSASPASPPHTAPRLTAAQASAQDRRRIISPLKKHSPAPPAQKGIALGLYCEDAGWSYEPLLREIAQLGGSHVSLVVAYYLQTIYATQITTHPRYTAPDAVIVRTIKQARALGLEVMLFPILRVHEKPTADHWRGNLKPQNRRALQAAYIQRLTHLAKMAQKHAVAVLSVGSELSSLDTDAAWWRPIIRAVRKAYTGKLLYSGNWDHFKKVRLWSQVDYLGLCGYFGIAPQKKHPPLHRMIAGWRDLRADLERWSRVQKKPLVFTEVGYQSQQGAARAPWDEGAKKPLSLKEQKHAYEAFVRVWNQAPRLAGVYFWNWYGWGGPKDRTYTPRRKPAARIIRWWYGGPHPVKWWIPR